MLAFGSGGASGWRASPLALAGLFSSLLAVSFSVVSLGFEVSLFGL